MASVRRDQVRAALADLPEPQRKALMLAYFGGYSQSEIAQLTGIPLGTVKTRTLAALRRLRGSPRRSPAAYRQRRGGGSMSTRPPEPPDDHEQWAELAVGPRHVVARRRRRSHVHPALGVV